MKPNNFVPRLFLGVTLAALTLTLFTLYSTEVLGHYGYGLFVALPFATGLLLAPFVHAPRTWRFIKSSGIVLVSLGFAGLLLLAMAYEGIICLIMALPLMLVLALAGVLLALVVDLCASWRGRDSMRALVPAGLLLPLFLGMTVESTLELKPPLRSVTSAVTIQGSAENVWEAVVAFPPIEARPEGIHQWGIAYPLSASIEGEGVGAIRRCTFNTGDFVEPITAWEAPRLLAFDVTSQPLPMREWSPYGDIDTPHMHGYLASERGQFQLTALDDGTIRLEGTTWYRHDLWPAFYWGALSDRIIHQIHLRVLEHIRDVVESGSR